MSNLRMLAAAYVGALALLVSGMQLVGADPILGVIDIRPILNRHPGLGNSLGLAYNPTSDVIYLSHGSDPSGGFIYTLDINGNLLNELNFQLAYRPGSYPTSLSYDRSSGHLFVFAFGVGDGIGNIVEMSPDGSTIFREFTVPLGGGGGIVVRDDGIWQSLFASDIIRHYTRDGVFIKDVSVASSFPGFPGPIDLTSSFMGGFFIVDFFGRRIVEVDIAGNEVVAVSTASLGDGRGLAIASDVNTKRIFLQVNNEQIYVLSSEFVPERPPTNRCPLGQGFWKNHPDAWPVTSLTLGSQTYTQAALLALFDTPPRGDASLILADQLIAAKLNLANGSDPTPISATITDADSLLSQFGSNRLPYNVRTSSAIGQQMVNDANVLDRYNNGDLTPDCQP